MDGGGCMHFPDSYKENPMKVYGQDRGSAVIEFNFKDFKAGVFTPSLKLPHGSIITGGYLAVTQASDAGTTDTIAIGVAGTPAQNLAATDVKTVATTTFGSLLLANNATLGLTRATTGAAPTKGEGVVVIDYIVRGKCDYIVGDLAEKDARIGREQVNVPR